MTAQPGHHDRGAGVGLRALAPSRGPQFRSATGKLVVVALVLVIVAVAIAVGGLRVADPSQRWQQVSAGSLSALGAVVIFAGLIRLRACVGDDVVDLARMHRTGTVLTVAAVLAWLGLLTLWVLALLDPFGGGSESTKMVAAVLSIPIGGTALVATFLRRLPMKVERGWAAYEGTSTGPQLS